MSYYLGIIFAFIALLSWGFGDFFIQKTTRIVGIWKALFFIGAVGLVGLFPFVKNEIFQLEAGSLLLLSGLGIVVVFGSLFNFAALKQGKIAIVEPLIGLELPLTVCLSISLGKERLTLVQFFLIAIVVIGILAAVTIHHTHLHYHKRIFEKGVILAGVGAIGMALTNFFVGISSQQISPLMTIWFAHSLLALVCAVYLIYQGDFKTIISDLRHHPKTIIGQSLLDNLAWVAFALATTFIPIAIATTISESYIVLAVLLGLFINREKLRRHQVVGIILAIGGVLVLAFLSS